MGSYTLTIELGPGLGSHELLDSLATIADGRDVLLSPAFGLDVPTGTISATFNVEASSVVEATELSVIELGELVRQALNVKEVEISGAINVELAGDEVPITRLEVELETVSA